MENGIDLYTTNELLYSKNKGIPGFIDERGLADLKWIEDNLGSPVMVAAGKCPNCGHIQMTIYCGFKYTNCLNCGIQLPLESNRQRKEQFLLLENDDTFTDYEEIIEEHDFDNIVYKKIAKTLFTIHIEQSDMLWPVIKQNPLYKRLIYKFKILCLKTRKVIDQLISIFKR